MNKGMELIVKTRRIVLNAWPSDADFPPLIGYPSLPFLQPTKVVE